MSGDVLLVLDELVPDRLLDLGGAMTERRHAMNHARDEMKAVEVVHHHHVERGGGWAFLFEAA